MKSKPLVFFLLLFIVNLVSAQEIKNIIIITTDGFRWQELYTGMDSAIAVNSRFNQRDSSYIFSKYWDADPQVRRKKLLPFFWGDFAASGQLYGNRQLGNRVDNANPHWFSYPGYSEIFTGYADEKINSNDFEPNPHVTLLEYLNRMPAHKNKVAAFGAWEAFNRILNEKRSGIPVVAAFDTTPGPKLTATQLLINRMLLNSYKPWGKGECLDVFTHAAALEYMKANKPSVLFIGYGETDEWAHAGQYKSYLDAANQVDTWIRELWQQVQSDPTYRNKTAIFITTDHGRGDKTKTQWTDHGSEIVGANEIWFALIGPGIPAIGEVKNEAQFYQKQFAATIASLLGANYQP